MTRDGDVTRDTSLVLVKKHTSRAPVAMETKTSHGLLALPSFWRTLRRVVACPETTETNGVEAAEGDGDPLTVSQNSKPSEKVLVGRSLSEKISAMFFTPPHNAAPALPAPVGRVRLPPLQLPTPANTNVDRSADFTAHAFPVSKQRRKRSVSFSPPSVSAAPAPLTPALGRAHSSRGLSPSRT